MIRRQGIGLNFCGKSTVYFNPAEVDSGSREKQYDKSNMVK